jgi:hypothetical protein
MADAAARDVILAMSERRMSDLAARYASGAIDIGEFQAGMRDELKRAYALQVIAGNDGEMPTADDWLRLGPALRSQFLYLEDFAKAMAAGEVEGDAIGSRAALYARSAQSAYWGQAMPDMPAQPCDGTSECLSNCKCSWLDNGDGTYTWQLGTEKNCPTCEQRANDWNPYTPEAA